MADSKAPVAAAPADAAAAPAKKPKTILVVAVVVVLEAVGILGAMMFLGGGAKSAEAVEMDHAESVPDEDMIVEVPVIDAKLPNNKSGVTYIYAVEIFAQVRKRDADRVSAEVQQFQNEIKAETTAIWRTAEPHHFQEPKLENLTRKVTAYLNERFGTDNKEQPIITKVVIVMSTGFRVDD